MKKILLTGATGFIGNYLLQEFATDHEIICIVRKESKNANKIPLNDKIKIFYHDIKEPILEVPEHLKNVDIVLHCAANPSSESSILNPILAVYDNVIGTANILEFSRKNNIKKFVYYSAAEVFGPIQKGQDSFEDDRYNSNSPYAATKAGGEELCVAYSKTYGLQVSIIHLTNTFGPGCQNNRFPILVINNIINNLTIDIHVDKDNNIGGRRWLYAGDVAEHTRFILNNQIGMCEKWNSSGKEFITNLEFAKEVCKILNKEFKYNLVPTDRPGHDAFFSVSPKKLYDHGWKEKYSFQERLKYTVGWYINNKKQT